MATIVDPTTNDGWQQWAGHLGIGAGELPAVLGIDHRESPRGLYERKQNQKTPAGKPPAGGKRSSNPLVRQGKDGEDQARAALQEHMAISGEQHIICEQPGWLKAQVDAMAELGVPGALEWSGPAEIKIPSIEVYDEIREQGRQHPAIWQWHYPQIQAQMYATGSSQGLLWFWRPDRRGIKCVLDRDDDYISWMLETVDDWVRRYLYGDEEPPVDDRVVVDMSKEPAWVQQAEQLKALNKEKRELEHKICQAKSRMANMLGEYSRGQGAGISINASLRQQPINLKKAAQELLNDQELEAYRPPPKREVHYQVTDQDFPRNTWR